MPLDLLDNHNETSILKKWVGGKKMWFIPNILPDGAAEATKASNEKSRKELLELFAIEIEMIDLQDYLGGNKELEKKISELDWVFVKGGNVFGLRDAIEKSWFATLINNMQKTDFLYVWYDNWNFILASDVQSLIIIQEKLAEVV
jgi:peptidase E